jgi:tetratricopeptide (TPR) repeat protein
MVESAAWITERKNVLSLVFYLGAGLAYLRYTQGVTGVGCRVTRTDSIRSRVTRHPSLFYALAFVLFLGALLAKTTTFSLPAAILLLGWWQRGQIRWRADVWPALPFFVLALGLCAVTAWLEKYHVGAQGSDFALSFPQRCLVAGHVFWFYLGKLFWPANLCFVYPRWQPDPGSGWQWLYPVTALGALFTFWRARGRIGRGPVTALLFFVGTLFPVLGFLNAYGMRYSFVWDHWVYLSALGIIALVAALVARAAEVLRTPAVVYGFAAIVLPVFAVLTWRQAETFTDTEILWRTTLARNPDCWMAHGNLGLCLKNQGRTEEAMEHYHKAIQINPDYREALNNLALVLAASPKAQFRNGAEAVRLAERACDLTHYGKPVYIGTLAAAYAEAGRFSEAVAAAEKAEQLATAAGLTAVAAKNRQLLELYRADKPYHESATAGH